MTQPEQTTPVAAALRELGVVCLSVYMRSLPDATLFEQACKSAGNRAAQLLRAYPQEGTTELRKDVPFEDRSLFLAAGRECLQLALRRAREGAGGAQGDGPAYG